MQPKNMKLETIIAADWEEYDLRMNGVTKVGRVYREIDGYYVWVPDDRKGFLPGWAMRMIADKLDELNKEWDAVVNSDPAINGGEETPSEPASVTGLPSTLGGATVTATPGYLQNSAETGPHDIPH